MWNDCNLFIIGVVVKKLEGIYAIGRGHTMESIQSYPEGNMAYTLHCIATFYIDVNVNIKAKVILMREEISLSTNPR